MTTSAGTPADPPADDADRLADDSADDVGAHELAVDDRPSGDLPDAGPSPEGAFGEGVDEAGEDPDDQPEDEREVRADDAIERQLARLAAVLDPDTVVELEPEDEPGFLSSSITGPAVDASAARPVDEIEPEVNPDPVVEAIDPVVGSALDGWRTLARSLRPRATKGQLLAGLLCAVLGFALAVQVRQTATVNLSTLRQEDLLRILDEATTRGDDLASEVSALEHERNQLLSDGDTRQAARDAARRTAIAQGILTGRLPAQGPGVTVTITDPDGTVKPATLLNFMEELRNAGAEAIELNDLRVTASSAFTGDPGSVVLDGVIISPPYRWTVIGDPDTIAPALEIPGGAVATVRGNGGAATVDQQDLVTIDALRTTPEPSYATPVPPTTG